MQRDTSYQGCALSLYVALNGTSCSYCIIIHLLPATLAGGCNPKNMSQIGSFPQVGVKITKYLKPPPSYMIGKGNFPTNPSMEKRQSFRAGTSSKGFSVSTFRVKLDWFSTMLPDWPEDSVGFFGKHKASVTRNFGVTGRSCRKVVFRRLIPADRQGAQF